EDMGRDDRAAAARCSGHRFGSCKDGRDAFRFTPSDAGIKAPVGGLWHFGSAVINRLCAPRIPKAGEYAMAHELLFLGKAQCAPWFRPTRLHRQKLCELLFGRAPEILAIALVTALRE